MSNKNPGGRPRKAASEQRSAKVNLRLTPGVDKALREAAAEENRSVSQMAAILIESALSETAKK